MTKEWKREEKWRKWRRTSHTKLRFNWEKKEMKRTTFLHFECENCCVFSLIRSLEQVTCAMRVKQTCFASFCSWTWICHFNCTVRFFCVRRLVSFEAVSFESSIFHFFKINFYFYFFLLNVNNESFLFSCMQNGPNLLLLFNILLLASVSDVLKQAKNERTCACNEMSWLFRRP